MTDATIISDPARKPIVAQRHNGGAGGVALRGHFNGVLVLSRSEIERLVEFARSDEPPRLGRIQRYPVTPPAAPPSDELNWLE
ncbi:MAG: hypothetical protein ACLQLO_33560 [Mycobacterium sp.]